MLSSSPPPRPPPHRALVSDERDQTQYSLDLDALALDDGPSGLDSPSVHPVIDAVHSDDIDGPTDFTVNLAKYFKGTPQKRPLPTWHKEQDMFDDESADFLTNSSPNNSSPRIDQSTQSSQAAEDPTPRPEQGQFDQLKKTMLQPTVEDYHSDLTPARPASLHLTPEPAQRRSYSTSRLQHSQNQRPSSPPTISSMRSPMPHFESTPDHKSRTLHQELQTLREANESLQSQLDSERASRQYQQFDRPSSKGISSHTNELDSLRNELSRIQEQSQDYQDQLNTLRTDLDKAKAAEKDALRLADDRAKELDQMHDTEDAEIHNLHVQLGQARDAERQTHNALDKVKEEMRSKDSQLSDMRSELKQAQDNLRETENDLDVLKTWNEGQRKVKSDELQRVQQELADARKEVQQAREDRDEDLAVNRSKVDVDGETPANDREKVLESEIKALQSQLDDLRRQVESKDTIIADLKSQTQASESAEDLKEQLQQAQSDLSVKDKAIQSAREEADTKAAEMTRALAQQLQQAKQRITAYETSSSSSNSAILQDLEHQLQKVRDELSAAKIQHASDKDAWAKADSEAQTSQSAVYSQLQKERETRKKADEKLRTLHEELEILQHFNRMNEHKDPSLDKNAFASSLQQDLQALTAQLAAQQKAHQEEVAQLRSAFSSANATAELKADHMRTISLIEEGMTALRTSRDSLALRVKDLESQLQTSQSALSAAESSLKQQSFALEEKEAQPSLLSETNASLVTDLATTTSALEASRKELSDLQALNLEFDTKLSETLRKREDAWRSKIKDLKTKCKELAQRCEVLEEERKVMGKALLGFWGKEEFGEGWFDVDGMEGRKNGQGEGQKFKYKFAKG